MPVRRGKDSKGTYYQWGKSGKKYYYKTGNKASRTRAKNKALKQALAIRLKRLRGENRIPKRK
jgi:hypothetical protein